MQITAHKLSYIKNRIDETKYSENAHLRRKKLKQFDQLKAEGCQESTILEVLQISRASYYRWRKNYKIYGLSGLENGDCLEIIETNHS